VEVDHARVPERGPIDSGALMMIPRRTLKLPSVGRRRLHSPALKSDFRHDAALSIPEQVRVLMRRVTQPGIILGGHQLTR
jgi:hypothetical protein